MRMLAGCTVAVGESLCAASYPWVLFLSDALLAHHFLERQRATREDAEMVPKDMGIEATTEVEWGIAHVDGTTEGDRPVREEALGEGELEGQHMAGEQIWGLCTKH